MRESINTTPSSFSFSETSATHANLSIAVAVAVAVANTLPETSRSRPSQVEIFP